MATLIKKLTLTQQPYLAGTHDHPIYMASAVDVDGEDYTVTWDLKADHDLTDEADAYASITKDGEQLDVNLFDVHAN